MYYVAAVLLLLVLIMALPIEISIFYKRRNQNDLVRLRVATFWNLLGITAEIPVATLKTICLRPVLKMVGEVESGQGEEVIKEPQFIDFTDIDYRKLYRMIKRFRRLLHKYQKPLLSFVKGLRVKRFIWKTELGLGDPALTGLSVGLAWSVKGWIYGFLHRWTTFVTKQPQVQVNPLFRSKGFGTEADCIIGFTIGHIMVTGINIISTRLWPRRG